MTHIEKNIVIDASQETVWEALADFGGIKKFHAGLRDSYPTSTTNGGLGATRHCDLKPMGSIEERVIGWNEGEGYMVEIYDGKKTPPFRSAFGIIRIERISDKQTRAYFALKYHLKYGIIGKAMDAIMVKRQFVKATDIVLSGLKSFAEENQKELV